MTRSRNTRRKNTPTFLPITRVLRHPTDGGRAGEATAPESRDRSVVSHDALLSASTQIPQRGAFCPLVDLLEKVPSRSQRVCAERVTFCSHHLVIYLGYRYVVGRFHNWLFVSIMTNSIPPTRYIEQEHKVLIFQKLIQILLL